VPFFLES
jgi:hypothetical protein